MARSVSEIVESYNPNAALAEAYSPTAEWYTDERILDLERRTVFAKSWQMVGRASQVRDPAGSEIRALRAGARAFYLWIYPNLMLNCYEGTMDSNLLLPLGVDRPEVIFNFYFTDVSDRARQHYSTSIALSERLQEENVAICNSVQRGLNSRAYKPGRLAVRREAGEHLFHRLLYADLKAGLPPSDFRNP